MSDDRRSRAEELARAALVRPPVERLAYLDDVTGGDADLRREVEALVTRMAGAELDVTHTGDRRADVERDRRQWGEFELRGEIGRGGYGTVYRAWDSTLAREVALKIIRLRTPDEAAAVLREGQMLARVRHRNVVTVYSARRIDDEVGIAMELVSGETLEATVRRSGPLGPEEAAVIGISVCRALAAVHGAGLVHRDVKAHNVIREARGRVVLTDLGAGRDRTEEHVKAGGDLKGTPLYLAPELFGGAAASPASDLYSLGVLLFYVVTGEYPVTERTLSTLALAHALKRRKLLPDTRPDLPQTFVEVVDRAMEMEPARRYRTAGAMMTALAKVIPTAALDSPESGTPPGALSGGAVGALSDTGPDPMPGSTAVGAATGFGTRWAWWSLGGLLGVWVLGMLMSWAFDVTFRRSEFSDDTVFTWLAYGVRSLIAPAVYALLTMVVFMLARTVARSLPAAVPVTRRPIARAHALVLRSITRLGMTEPAVAAQWLLVAQVIALGVILWVFRDVMLAFVSFMDVADPEQLRVLDRNNPLPVQYRQSLTVALLLMALAWGKLLSNRADRRAVERNTVTVGLGVLAIGVLMLELPYRVMYQNLRPVMQYGELRCYDFGRSAAVVLLYCPASPPPRIIRVSADDRDLTPVGIQASVFELPPR